LNGRASDGLQENNVGSELQAGNNTSLILSPAASRYPYEEETDGNPIASGWSTKKRNRKTKLHI